MNVPFVTGDEELDAQFVKEAKAAGFENLKGHRTVGGMRASIYNAMPMEGVEKLVDFMDEFRDEGTGMISGTGVSEERNYEKDSLLKSNFQVWHRTACRRTTVMTDNVGGGGGHSGAQRLHARDGAAGESAGRGQSRSRRQQHSAGRPAPRPAWWCSTPPGANANGVKELVLAGMLLASRDMVGGIEWCRSNADDPEDIAKATGEEQEGLRRP